MPEENTYGTLEPGVSDRESWVCDQAIWLASKMWEDGIRSPEDVDAFLAIFRRCWTEVAQSACSTYRPAPPPPYDPNQPQHTGGPHGSDDPSAPPVPQSVLPDPQPGDGVEL